MTEPTVLPRVRPHRGAPAPAAHAGEFYRRRRRGGATPGTGYLPAAASKSLRERMSFIGSTVSGRWLQCASLE